MMVYNHEIKVKSASIVTIVECMFHLWRHFGYCVSFFLVGAPLLAMTSKLKVLDLLWHVFKGLWNIYWFIIGWELGFERDWSLIESWGFKEFEVWLRIEFRRDQDLFRSWDFREIEVWLRDWGLFSSCGFKKMEVCLGVGLQKDWDLVDNSGFKKIKVCLRVLEGFTFG